MSDTFCVELCRVQSSLLKRAFVLTRDRDRAEDLLSETNVRALRYRDKFEIGTNLAAWASFIMRNFFLSQMRRSKWDGGSVDQMLESQLPSRPAPQGSSIDLADTMKALSELPKDQRDAVLLVGSGATYEEAAEEMCCSVGTVKSRVARGRDALQELLA